MDAAALKATLVHLGETMPPMAPLVGEAIDGGLAAARGIRELVRITNYGLGGGPLGGTVAANELVADIQLANVELAVEAFKPFAVEQTARLDEAYQDVLAKIEAYDELDSPLAELDSGVGEVEGAFTSFQEKLAAGVAAGNAAAEAFNEKLEALFGAVEEGAQQLSAALDSATSAFESLQEGLNAGRDAVLSEVDSFVSDLTGRQEELSGQVTDYVSKGRAWMADLGGQLSQGFPSMIEAEVGKALDEVQAKIQEQIQTLVREAMDKVVGALDGFADKLAEANEGSALGREILQPLFDQFGELADPLVGALDSIKSAASTVGIDI
jgi:uncharacterized phage infection (PIP) family protein YhgE